MTALEEQLLRAFQQLDQDYSARERLLHQRLNSLLTQLSDGLLQVQDLRVSVQHLTRQVGDLSVQVARLQAALTPP
jgi:hypothetical protein